MAQFSSEEVEHRCSALSVDVFLLEFSSQFFLVLVSDHLEEVQVPVQRLVFVFSQLFNYRLDPKHQELVPEVEPELQSDLTRSVIEHCVDKGHYGCLQRQIILVDSKVFVQVVYYALKPCPLGMILLKV